MMDLQLAGLVNLADRKGGAGDLILAASTTCKTAGKGGLAAAQVADQLNYFPALQVFA